jgi:hypothetical protein
VRGRRGRRRRKLLDDIKERRGYSDLKEEALDRTMWSARFGRGVGPVVRQTTKLISYMRVQCYTGTSPFLFFCHTVIEARYFLLNCYKPCCSVYMLVGTLATPYLQLTSYKMVSLYNLPVTQVVKNSPLFHGTEGSCGLL